MFFMKDKKRTIVVLLTTSCFVGIIFTLTLLINWNKNVKTNIQIQQKIANNIEINEQKHDINFDKLRNINEDTVGYLEVPNTNINYVVVKGKNNSYYLNHNFNKEKNVAGWIFMDYKNKADGTDKNIVIYGHDTADESMFGSLSKLLEKKNLEDKNNLIISFITNRDIKKYQMFSIYTIEPEEYYIKTIFKEKEFDKFKEKLRNRSIYKLDANLKNKNIITLSTCQNYGIKRLAVHAVEI